MPYRYRFPATTLESMAVWALNILTIRPRLGVEANGVLPDPS